MQMVQLTKTNPASWLNAATRKNVTAPSETAKSVDIGILDMNMFIKFLKNSNSMFDVALRM